MNIPDKWIPYLDSMNDKDLAILIRAIIHKTSEPTISAKSQPLAHIIYEDIKKAKYFSNAMRKSRQKVKPLINSDLTVNLTVNKPLINSDLTVNQEERKEDAPLSPPLFPSPTPLSNYPPIIPPEEKREEDTPSIVPPAAEAEPRKPSLESRFEELWKLYPKKAGKVTAFRDYQQAVKDGVTDEEIADGISRYNEHIRISRTEPRYILQGSTYFHQRRWEDEFSDSGTPELTAEELEELHAVFG